MNLHEDDIFVRGPDDLAVARERRTYAAMERERAQREARRRLDAETRGPVLHPVIETLRERLARPRLTTTWRLGQWQPTHTRVMLAAQFKAGKSTLVGNVLRSLVDGDAFLGQEPVLPITGTVVLLDFEMGAGQLTDWLGAQRITADDRVVVVPLRGRAASFDIADPGIRAEWVARLRQHRSTYLVLDCLRPILDALGLDEHREVTLRHRELQTGMRLCPTGTLKPPDQRPAPIRDQRDGVGAAAPGDTMTRAEIERLVQTSVTALTYDVSRRTGHLRLPLGCCTDMSGDPVVHDSRAGRTADRDDSGRQAGHHVRPNGDGLERECRRYCRHGVMGRVVDVLKVIEGSEREDHDGSRKTNRFGTSATMVSWKMCHGPRRSGPIRRGKEQQTNWVRPSLRPLTAAGCSRGAARRAGPSATGRSTACG